jgi:hypothetical protein
VPVFLRYETPLSAASAASRRSTSLAAMPSESRSCGDFGCPGRGLGRLGHFRGAGSLCDHLGAYIVVPPDVQDCERRAPDRRPSAQAERAKPDAEVVQARSAHGRNLKVEATRYERLPWKRRVGAEVADDPSGVKNMYKNRTSMPPAVELKSVGMALPVCERGCGRARSCSDLGFTHVTG